MDYLFCKHFIWNQKYVNKFFITFLSVFSISKKHLWKYRRTCRIRCRFLRFMSRQQGSRQRIFGLRSRFFFEFAWNTNACPDLRAIHSTQHSDPCEEEPCVLRLHGQRHGNWGFHVQGGTVSIDWQRLDWKSDRIKHPSCESTGGVCGVRF